MGLNPRLKIACPRCEGVGWLPAEDLDILDDEDAQNATHIFSDEGDFIVCPDCNETGRDAEAEARLAELAGRLQTAAIMVLSYATAACTDEVARIRHGMVSDLDALAALLLAAGQPGAEPTP